VSWTLKDGSAVSSENWRLKIKRKTGRPVELSVSHGGQDFIWKKSDSGVAASLLFSLL
jgi:hypothetical protein